MSATAPERLASQEIAPSADKPAPRRGFLLHLHPVRVSERSLSAFATLGLGIATLTLALLLLVTGGLLMLTYVPAPERAYASMLDLEHVVVFGRFARRVHRFAAHAMVVTVVLHLVRVCAMAAYRRRILNWFIGLGLFALVLLFALTGYLLPWDQTAYWATRVVAGMLDSLPLLGTALKALLLGGAGVGAPALLRFYALHVAVLPVLLFGLVVLHLFRIRRDGGLARPLVKDEPMVDAWPHLVVRELVIALLVASAIGLLALLVDAPLGPPADLVRPDNPEKAPWYFLGLQEMVSYSLPLGAFWFPLSCLGLLVALPWLDRGDEGVGEWLGPARERRTLVVAGLGTLACVLGVCTPRLSAAWGASWAGQATNPAGVALVLAALAAGAALWARRTARAALRAALLVLALSLLVFTLLGAWRGPDWQLSLPWEGLRRGL